MAGSAPSSFTRPKRRSPIHALTGPDVQQLRWSRPTRYHWAKPRKYFFKFNQTDWIVHEIMWKFKNLHSKTESIPPIISAIGGELFTFLKDNAPDHRTCETVQRAVTVRKFTGFNVTTLMWPPVPLTLLRLTARCWNAAAILVLY